MGVLDSIRRVLGAREQSAPAVHETAEPSEISVPEITPTELLAGRRNGKPPLLLDCREDYEWRQGRISGSLHIPMRQIPGRLSEINREAEIVVVCAHGNRSHSVAGWLIGNGFTAVSLRGGVAGWQSVGGEVERG